MRNPLKITAKLELIYAGQEKENNIFIHGYNAISSRGQFDALVLKILKARPRGRVYLLYWKSGNWNQSPIVALAARVAKTGANIARKGKAINPIGLAIDLGTMVVFEAGKYVFFERAADKLGGRLSRHLAPLVRAFPYPVNLIGHSLGARVVQNYLAEGCDGGVKVKDAVLLGGAAKRDSDEWYQCSRQVSGKVYNIHSPNDLILKIPPGKRVGQGRVDVSGQKFKNVRFPVGHLQYWDCLPEILEQVWTKRRQSKFPIATQCPYGCNEKAWYILYGHKNQNCPSCGGGLEVEKDVVYASLDQDAVVCPCGKSEPIALGSDEIAYCYACRSEFTKTKTRRVNYVRIERSCPACGTELSFSDGRGEYACPVCEERLSV